MVVPEHDVVKLMDESREMFVIGIKHCSNYESQKAYEFLMDLVKASEKFSKHKQILEEAFSKIKPM